MYVSMRIIQHVFLFFIVMLMFSACTKDGDVIYKADPADVAATRPLVTVIYGADGVGDLSYNDLIYQGVEEAAQEYSLRTLQLSPNNIDEGLAYIEDAIKQMAASTDTVRRLLIVANSVYDEYIRKNNSRLEANPRASLLYLETKTPLEGKGSTLFLPYYGAMFEAGYISTLFASDILLIGANQSDEAVGGAMQGFNEGFVVRQTTLDGDYSTYSEGMLYTSYVSENAHEGYNINDEDALRLLNTFDTKSQCPLIVPICGGSAATFARMANLTGNYTYMGIDCAQQSLYSEFSTVKHIDRAIVKCIGQWLSPEGMPKHQTLGLSSGFTEVVLHPHTDEAKTAVQKWLTDDAMRTIREQAIRKEADNEK